MTSAEPVAWVLNLDAEEELARGGGAHTPSAALIRRVEALVPRLAGLIRPDDTLVFPRAVRAESRTTSDLGPEGADQLRRGPDEGSPVLDSARTERMRLLGRADGSPVLDSAPTERMRRAGRADGPPVLDSARTERVRLRGRCWCPTRWALEQLERAHLERPAAPALEVLRRVNHRRFAHELGETLPAAGFATTHHELKALLANTAALADVSTEVQWLLKRPFGYAGKGRRKLAPGPVLDADQAWLDASLRAGDGLQVEPWVERELDVALHGFLPAEGRVVWGQPTVQVLDSTGAWQSSRVASDGTLAPAERELLLDEGRRTAEALRSAGYFGPFGIDGFRWVDARGDRHFRPRCELNARYSMGWASGLGELRPDR